MSAKKPTSLSDLGGLVYSTNDDLNLNAEETVETPPPSEQNLEAHFEKKGRGGKTAVIIKGFQGSEDELEKLAKSLKKHCAVGGSSKSGEIILQGNIREKAMDFLSKNGYKVKRVGG